MATKPVNNPLPDFHAVMRLWPSRSALAADLGVEHWLVEAWHRKNSIPPRWFDEVTRASIKRDIPGISNDLLLQLHVKRVEEGPPESAPSKKNGEGRREPADADV